MSNRVGQPMTSADDAQRVAMNPTTTDEILDEMRPVLAGWMHHFGKHTCPHGDRFGSWEFEWWVNGYCFDEDEPERAVITLIAKHPGCMPVWFDRFTGAFTWDKNLDLQGRWS